MKSFSVTYFLSQLPNDRFETIEAENIVEANKIAEEHAKAMGRLVASIKEISEVSEV